MAASSFVGLAFIVILVLTLLGLLLAAWAINRNAKIAYQTRLRNQAWRESVDSFERDRWLLDQRVARMLGD